MADAFDQSFDFFEKQEGGKGWGSTPSRVQSNEDANNVFDTSFESDPFEFSAVSSAVPTEEEAAPTFFPSDPFPSLSRLPRTKNQTVRVAIQEQVSALYDDVSRDGGTVGIEGKVYVKPEARLSKPFYLVLKDHLGVVVSCEEEKALCQNTSNKVQRKGLKRNDRVFRVATLGNHLEDACVLTYKCASSLRPVPLLIKSRARIAEEFTRIGFKIRSNPSNELPLMNVVIILAVPPSMDGQSVRMSREGGMWDEMKRTLSWIIKRLDPGEALEIQAQFRATDGGAAQFSPDTIFPVLARCEYAKLFSEVDIQSGVEDKLTIPVRAVVNVASTVLHRKV